MKREEAIDEIKKRLSEIDKVIKSENLRNLWDEVYGDEKMPKLQCMLVMLDREGLMELLELCRKACATLNDEVYSEDSIEIERGHNFDELLKLWYVRNKVNDELREPAEDALKKCIIKTENIKDFKEKRHIGFEVFMESIISAVNNRFQKKEDKIIDVSNKVSNNVEEQNKFFKEKYNSKAKDGRLYSDIIQKMMESFERAFGTDNELRSRFTEILYANALGGIAKNRNRDGYDKLADEMFDAETSWETRVLSYRIIPTVALYMDNAEKVPNVKGADPRKIILSFVYNNNRKAISFFNRYHTDKAAGKFIDLYVKESDGKNFTDSLPKYWDPNGPRPAFAKGIERTVYTYQGKEVYEKDGKWWELISNKPVPESVVDSGAIEGKKVSMKTEDVTFLQALENKKQYACFTSESDFLAAFEDNFNGVLKVSSKDAVPWNKLKNEEKFAAALKNPAGYVILFDKDKYKALGTTTNADAFLPEEKFRLCTSIQPLESSENERQKENRYCIEKHSVWDMGHKPKHEYFLMHAIYMLSERFGKTKGKKDENFEKIYQTPEFYEVQTGPYNRGHVGDESWDIDGIIADYIDNKKEIEGLNL